MAPFEINSYSAALERWQRQSVPLLPAESLAQIESAFAALGMPVSNDVRVLYSSIGGFEDFATDQMFSLWSLKRIQAENQHRDGGLIWFADWCISAHMYGIKYSDPDSSIVYLDHNRSGLAPQEIAGNLFDFFRRYVDDPDDVEAWDIR